MLNYLYKPVTIIDGIGNEYARKLKKTLVIKAIDLLRCSPLFLYNYLNKKVSLKEIEGWRSQATFLQIYSMTPSYSKILYRAGMLNVEYISRASLSDLKQIFVSAKKKIRSLIIPSDDQICSWIKDSTVIHNTGSVSGNVIDYRKRPVEGADVKLGLSNAFTDKYGRFRLIRVPLGRDVKLKISHRSFKDFLSGNFKPVFGDNTISVITFKLKKINPSLKRKIKAVNANEFKGERIPFPNNFEKKTERMKYPRNGDIYMLFKISSNKTDKEPMATLISRFREVKDNIYIIYTVRIPAKSLPPSASRPDHFLFSGSEFKPVKINNAYLKVLVDAKKASSLLSKKKRKIRPGNIKDITASLNQWFSVYKKISVK